MIHIINENNQYVGSRELKNGEAMPLNATGVMPELKDNMIAFFDVGSNKWVYSTVEYPTIHVPTNPQPRLEQQVVEL